MIAILLKAGKVKILVATSVLVLAVSLLDWVVGHNVSLAALYILPMMLGAVVLRPAETAVAALFCAYLRSYFEASGSPVENMLRFIFAALAYFLSGLFITVLVRNHELVIRHLASIQVEQALRREAEGGGGRRRRRPVTHPPPTARLAGGVWLRREMGLCIQLSSTTPLEGRVSSPGKLSYLYTARHAAI